MKKFLMPFMLILCASAWSADYSCVIPRDRLGPGIELDITLEISVREDGNSSLRILGDLVSDTCKRPDEATLYCSDAEGMPHLVKIINDRVATITIGNGMFLPETKAECERG